MKFITNRIVTGKSKTLDELFAKKEVVKMASSQPEVKIAEEKKEKDEVSSGQLDVEPLHQTGESTPTPGKKEEKAAGKDVKDTNNENTKPAESSGQPEVEGKKENNNDPKAGEHREGDGDQKKAVAQEPAKTAAQKCDCGADLKDGEKCCAKCKETKDCSAATQQPGKEAAGNIANLTAPKFGPGGKPVEKKDDDKKEDEKEEKKDAASTVKFVKVSNLNAKDKTWLKKYWRTLYPAEYADAMTADK